MYPALHCRQMFFLPYTGQWLDPSYLTEHVDTGAGLAHSLGGSSIFDVLLGQPAGFLAANTVFPLIRNSAISHVNDNNGFLFFDDMFNCSQCLLCKSQPLIFTMSMQWEITFKYYCFDLMFVRNKGINISSRSNPPIASLYHLIISGQGISILSFLSFNSVIYFNT